MKKTGPHPGATGLFVAVSHAMLGGRTQRLDIALMQRIERFHTPLFDVAALEITALGSLTVVALVAAVASTLLWTSEHRWSVLLLWAAIAGGTVLNLISRLERPRPLRLLTWAGAAVLIALIAASRVYLGVHYPSDVLAGVVLGFLWTTICAAGIEVLRYFRVREPQLRHEEKDLDRGTSLAPATSNSQPHSP